MKLVAIFLPLADNEGRAFPDELFARVRNDLTDRFGGVTSFSRAPALGVSEEGGRPVHDDIVVVEVMMETLDRTWWQGYRQALERDFRQDEILIRASDAEKI